MVLADRGGEGTVGETLACPGEAGDMGRGKLWRANALAAGFIWP